MKIPTICLGTLKLEPDALRRGLNHFTCLDLAKAYNNEEAVGKILKETGMLNDIFVITKLHDSFLKNHNDIKNAIKDSTKKIGKIPDLVLIHGPYPFINLVEAAKSLESLAKAWGVSNFEIEHLDDLKKANLHPMINQVECHPYFPRHTLLNYSRANGIAFQGYRPLAEGSILTEPILKKIADKHKTDTASIVYAWLHKRGCGIVSKVSSAENQKILAKTGSLTLTDEDMNLIASLEKPDNQGRTCIKGGWFTA